MRKELLQKISEKLNDKGFRETCSDDIFDMSSKPFSPDTGVVSTLRWLPEENLREIAEYDISRYSGFGEVYQAWGREGFFKFEPYITDGAQSLCLRHNRFMHMFRGYYFQISDTCNGVGENHISTYRTDGIMQLLRYDKVNTHSHLLYIMMMSQLISCGFQNDNFRNAFYNDKELIDEFFKKSMHSWDIDFPYDYSLIKKYVSYRRGNLIPSRSDYINVYQITLKNNVVCRFFKSDELVEVEFNPSVDIISSKIVSFRIPDVAVGIDSMTFKHWDEDEADDLRLRFEKVLSPYDSVCDWILVMLLELVGIHASFYGTYATRKVGSIPVLNGYKFTEFKDLNWEGK